MPLYLYRCDRGHLSEMLRGVSVHEVECECGQVAQRQSIYATAIGGRVRPPVAERKVNLSRYVEASEEIAYRHDRAEESAQRSLPKPNLWAKAKANAEKLQKAGISDSMDYDPRYVK